MKIFVTGATGFIGSYFVKNAIARGHAITALRRSERSRCCLPLAEPPIWLTRELKDLSPVDLKGHDALVHFASAGVSPQSATWDELFLVNVSESLRLLLSASSAGVERLVICGSCFEYGRSGERYQFIPADAPLEPTSGYGASKAAATIASLALATERQLKLIVLRPFQVFGFGQHENNFWPSLRRAALAGEDFPMTWGEQYRDYAPVENVAAKFVDACEFANLAAGVPVVENVGTGRAQMLKEFAESCWKAWSATGRLKFGEVPYRASEVMRYVPLVTARWQCSGRAENIDS